MSSEPDRIYYDLQTKNLSSTTSVSEQLVFSDLRNAEVVKDASKYKLSVVRFQADTSILPVFIPTIQLNQPNPNLTIYTVRLDYAGLFVEVPVIWQPEILSAAVPPAPNTLPFGRQQNTQYYHSLNYQHFINLINVALKSAMDQLKVLSAPVNDSVLAPFLGWNSNTLCAELLASPLFETRPIKLFFNRALYALFSSFQAVKFPNNTSLGEIYELQLLNNNSYNLEINYKNTGVNKIVLKQNYSTIANWSPVSAIVFTSQNLPVVPAFTSVPLISINGQTTAISGNNSNTVNIITDIATTENSYKPTLIYVPSAEYRFIDLYSSAPIRNVELRVFWRATDGTYQPLLVPSGGASSIKLLFQRKGLDEQHN